MTEEAKAKILEISQQIEAELPFYPRQSRTMYAVRGGYRVPVHISRGRETGFYASAKLDRYGHSAWGKTPADAFAKIVVQLGWTIDKLIAVKQLGVPH